MTDTLQFPAPLTAPRHAHTGDPPPPCRVLLGRVGTRGCHVPMSLVYHAGHYYARIEGGVRIHIRPEAVVAWALTTDRREWPRPAFDSALRWLACYGNVDPVQRT